MEGQAIPRTTKKSRKNDLRANTLHALVFFEKDTKKVPKFVPKMTPLGLGNHLLHTFWTLGLRAAQKVCTKLPREAPGTPNGPPKVPKGSKMVPQSEPKLEHSVKNNIKRLKEKTKKQQPNKKEKV